MLLRNTEVTLIVQNKEQRTGRGHASNESTKLLHT